MSISIYQFELSGNLIFGTYSVFYKDFSTGSFNTKLRKIWRKNILDAIYCAI